MNRLPLETRSKIFHSLMEGLPIRATARVFGVDKNSVLNLGADVGRACLAYHDKHVRDFKCDEIQCDELHSFCHTRDENLRESEKGMESRGTYFTWIALDPITKLSPAWHVGRRTAADAETFMQDLASRLVGRIQISTDGFKGYLSAIEKSFGADEVDYAQLLKIFNNGLNQISAADWLQRGRHGPRHPALDATRKIVVSGNPNLERVGTAHIERYNLTIRMSLRRYTRDVNSHSKVFEYHRLFTGAYQFFYNFARPHSALKVKRKGGAVIQRTPAMAAGLTDRVWKLSEIVGLAN